VAIDFPEPGDAARLDRWKVTSAAETAAKAFYAELDAAYVAHKEADFGDDDAFEVICEAVAEGPELLWEPVRQYVPAGYRAQAIGSSKRAQTALRKLKDPNGIPALELASLRATEGEQAELAEMVEIFYAYQELIGGGNRNVPYWGQKGWELGALQSFGEPLALEVDRLGNVYVADTGNNRIQMYAGNGKPETIWGPDPDLSTAWFERGRPWYVTGSASGDEPGRWLNPVDIDLIPEKESDAWAALDSDGRIQIYGGDGKARISWRVEGANDPEPGLGGEAYLAWVAKKKQLCAVLGDDVVCYTLDSEEVGRWEIEDGTPNAVEVDKSGRFLMVFGSEVISYSIDGFRYGTVMGNDVLGEGFEDVDLTLDEKRKLWAMTDTGWLIAFKKPGKVDFRIQVSDYGTENQRIAVREGMLYYSYDDRIHTVDVLQLKLDREQAKE